jgi:hypothetical protein
MFAPVTSLPAAGAAVPLAGATVPADGAAVAAGVVVAAGAAGLELVHPAINIATTTKIIANTLIGENFIGNHSFFNKKFPVTPPCSSWIKVFAGHGILSNGLY